ncbi:MAG: hypothetical protein ACOZQL_24480 [Myxococcota bacterium]
MRLLLLTLASSLLLFACPAEKCSASTCATGCCDANGECQLGTTTAACGLAGGACSACQLTQQCIQGACFGGSVGGGGGGSGNGGGGGSMTGGGGGSMTGGGGGGLLVFPQTAQVPQSGSLVLSARLFGGSDPRVAFIIESGGGFVRAQSPNSAVFYPSSGNAGSVRIRAEAVAMSSVAQLIELTIRPELEPFSVFPQGFSSDAYLVANNARQTFAGTRFVSTNVVGVPGLQWHRWPLGESTSSTVTATADLERVYALEMSTGVWSSTEVSGVASAPEPSIEVSPAVATVAPRGVVQLTAMVSSGGDVRWDVVSNNGGAVTSSGTYTAPSTPGVYVVQATPTAGSGLRFALATIIVQ